MPDLPATVTHLPHVTGSMYSYVETDDLEDSQDWVVKRACGVSWRQIMPASSTELPWGTGEGEGCKPFMTFSVSLHMPISRG